MTEQGNSQSLPKRIVLSLILILLVLGVSGAIAAKLYRDKPKVEEKSVEVSKLNVDVFEVKLIDFRELLTGFGTVRADREVIIAAEVSGTITEIHPQLKVGSAVHSATIEVSENGPSQSRAADQLLTIDQRDYLEQLEQAESQIAELSTQIDQLKVQKENVARQLVKAQSVLKTLQTELNRVQEGVAKRVSTPAELNKALLEVQRYEDTIIQLESTAASLPHQIKAAEQRLAVGRSQKTRAENDFGRTKVTPPFDGVLSEVFVEQGKFVRTGDQLLRLTDLTRMEVPIGLGLEDQLQLDRILASGVRPSVNLAINETADPKWTGRLVRVAPEADSRSRTVQVFVEVDNSPTKAPLLPGAFVHARIDGDEFEQSIIIPRNAIINSTVYVVDENKIVRRRKIDTGKRFQSLVHVTEGLSSGDRVVVTNLDIVEEGKEVVVQGSTGPHEEISTIRSPTIRPTQNVP